MRALAVSAMGARTRETLRLKTDGSEAYVQMHGPCISRTSISDVYSTVLQLHSCLV